MRQRTESQLILTWDILFVYIYYGSQWRLPTFFKIYFYFNRGKKCIQVWNNMRVS